MDKAAGNTGRTPWGTGAKGGRPKCEGCMRGDGLGWGCVAGTRSIRTSCDISHLKLTEKYELFLVLGTHIQRNIGYLISLINSMMIK